MKIKFSFLIAILITTCSINVLAQKAVLFGVRDNEYARIGYQDKWNWYVMVEHSVFVTKLKNQVINGYAGYKGNVQKLKYNGCLYGGIHYGGMYKMMGGMAEVKYPLLSWCNMFGGIRPHYDTSYGYDTAFRAGLSFAFHKAISLRGEFTSYPEYRLCEKRIKAGLDFKVMELIVSPEISIPIEGNIETIRLLMNFRYELHL